MAAHLFCNIYNVFIIFIIMPNFKNLFIYFIIPTLSSARQDCNLNQMVLFNIYRRERGHAGHSSIYQQSEWKPVSESWALETSILMVLRNLIAELLGCWDLSRDAGVSWRTWTNGKFSNYFNTLKSMSPSDPSMLIVDLFSTESQLSLTIYTVWHVIQYRF